MQVQKIYTTKSYKQTQKLGEKFAKEILKLKPQNHAVVIGLRGNLGAGKTTFLQGFAKGSGIKEKILSPTFVIQKRFQINIHQNGRSSILMYSHFYHFDCYRLKNGEEIIELDFKKIISDPKNIVAIEWPGKIKKVLPKNTVLINFDFVDNNKREIRFIENKGDA
jgi:tRNA threonylcarbamoyladenosine biosynthesis protein TsaE